MNKDDILQMAREKNQSADEYTLSVEAEAAKLSKSIGLAVCALLNLIVDIFFGSLAVSNACWVIFCTIVASDYWVRAARLKRRNDFLAAIFYTLVWVAFAFFLFTHL